MKKNKEPDYAAELEKDYARWDYLYKHGGSDPSWEDGVNLNLIRSHIIYYMKKLDEQKNLFCPLETYNRKVPPVMPPKYMARSDEIRANARVSMQIIEANENLKFVREKAETLTDKQKKQMYIPTVLGYAENLRNAIKNDDLITMRRYENVKSYLQSFDETARKIISLENSPEQQNKISPDEADEEENDEDFNDSQECESGESDDFKTEENIQVSFF